MAQRDVGRRVQSLSELKSGARRYCEQPSVAASGRHAHVCLHTSAGAAIDNSNPQFYSPRVETIDWRSGLEFTGRGSSCHVDFSYTGLS